MWWCLRLGVKAWPAKQTAKISIGAQLFKMNCPLKWDRVDQVPKCRSHSVICSWMQFEQAKIDLPCGLSVMAKSCAGVGTHTTTKQWDLRRHVTILVLLSVLPVVSWASTHLNGPSLTSAASWTTMSTQVFISQIQLKLASTRPLTPKQRSLSSRRLST